MNNYGLKKGYKVACNLTVESGNKYLIVEIDRTYKNGQEKPEYAIYSFDGVKALERLGKGDNPLKLEKKYAK